MQFGKRLNRCAQRPTPCRYRQPVEHPGTHNDDYTRIDLDVDHFTCRPVLAVLPAKPATIERMPAVENLNLLPDMGRMAR